MSIQPQPFGSQPFGGQSFGGLSSAGQAFRGLPFGSQPFGGLPFGSQPFGGQPFGSQPFGGQPVGGGPFRGPPLWPFDASSKGPFSSPMFSAGQGQQGQPLGTSEEKPKGSSGQTESFRELTDQVKKSSGQ